MPFVRPASDELSDLSYRLWRLTRESLRARYEQAGVPVVEWVDGVPLNSRAGGGGGIQAARTHRTRLGARDRVGARVRGGAGVRGVEGAGVRVADRPRSARSAQCCLRSSSCGGLDELLSWSLIPLGIAYTLSLVVHGSSVDDRAPLVAVGDAPLRGARVVVARRAARRSPRIATSSSREPGRSPRSLAASLAAAGLVVALSLAPGDGLAWTVLGAAAAVLVVAVAVRLTPLRASAIAWALQSGPVRGAFV